jgi:hypothetical protein
MRDTLEGDDMIALRKIIFDAFSSIQCRLTATILALLSISLTSLICGTEAYAEITRLRDSQSESSWQPAKTWAFVVGVLEWKDGDSFAPFPKDDRRDARLVQALRDRGVPSSQILYLQDNKATISAVAREFPKFLQKASPGDWLILYYAGHGYKENNGTAYLATYDASEDIPGWMMRAVPETIEKNFKGSHALITLDNCYSGAMAELVKRSDSRVSYGVFASSLASALSTQNWTFTESLLATLTGAPAADANHDGQITFAEVGAYIEGEMLFGEEQVAVSKFTKHFDPQMVFATADQDVGPRIGEHVEALTTNEWYKGVIVDSTPEAFKIHFYGYGLSDDEWVTAKNIRGPKLVQYKKGSRVQVNWKKTWYPATVLEVRDGSHLITYEGFDSTWDEWVPSARIRPVR